jgi:hypothetical protein
MMRLPLLTILSLALCACAAGSPYRSSQGTAYRFAATGTRIQVDQSSAVTMAAADQVKRCYRAPRVPTSGRGIVTRLRVRYSADGRLEEAPQIVAQEGVTPENRPYAGPMAEAASMAVLRCAPLRLPPELHRGGWDNFDLIFSPRAMV